MTRLTKFICVHFNLSDYGILYVSASLNKGTRLSVLYLGNTFESPTQLDSIDFILAQCKHLTNLCIRVFPKS